MKSDRIEIRCKVCDTPWEAPVIGCPKCKPTPSRAEEKDKLTLEERAEAASLEYANARGLKYRCAQFKAGALWGLQNAPDYQAGLREADEQLKGMALENIKLGMELVSVRSELSAAKSELNDWEGTCSRQYSEITKLREALEKIIALPKIPTRGGGYYTHESVPIAREALLRPGTKGEE